MRNIFDQYTQPENRITHALLTALHEDRKLLASFVRDLIGISLPSPAQLLSVLEQTYPEEDELKEEEGDRRGIPDGWIYSDDGWCVVIESKVMAVLSADQLRRHRRIAEQRGFKTITVVAITMREESVPDSVKAIQWRDVYRWLLQHSKNSIWAKRAATYLEVMEMKLSDTDKLQGGTLTMFSGIPFGFDNPVRYSEAKRLLILALKELRQRKDLKELGMQPNIAGRPKITGATEDRVWDFLSLSSGNQEKAFTHNLHLTLGIVPEGVDAMVTVPHGVNNHVRKQLIGLGENGFAELTATILSNMRPLIKQHAGAVPLFRGKQRRYPSQRSVPFVDASIEFDLRTAMHKKHKGEPKSQPCWLSAGYNAFVKKHGSNYQIQIGMMFPYSRCDGLRDPKNALDMIATAWLACKPLIDLTRKK